MILYISVISLVMSPLISVFIYLNALFILVSLAEGFLILFIFQKSTLSFIDLFIVLLISFICLCSNIYSFLSCAISEQLGVSRS